VLSPELTVAEALAKTERRGFSVYPVVDVDGRHLGLVNLPRLRRVIAEGGRETRLAELVRLGEYVYPEDVVIRAVVRMNALGTRHLPVVEKTTLRLCGLLTMSDIFRAQALAADAAEAPESARAEQVTLTDS
jgi:CBS domain-containing protein